MTYYLHGCTPHWRTKVTCLWISRDMHKKIGVR